MKIKQLIDTARNSIDQSAGIVVKGVSFYVKITANNRAIVYAGGATISAAAAQQLADDLVNASLAKEAVVIDHEGNCDNGPFVAAPIDVNPVAIDLAMPSGVHCTGHVDYDRKEPVVISTVAELKDLAPGTYTVTGEAAAEVARRSMPFGKVSVRVVNVAARRLREELASLRVKHGYRVVSDENGLRYQATRLVRPAVVLRIAKLKRLLDMATGRKPGPLWVYEMENSGRHYGYSDAWQRKPKFHWAI